MANAKRNIACDCKRRFATADALAQHRNDSPRHQDKQGQAVGSAPNDVIPASIAEALQKNKPASPVIVTKSRPSTNANATATPSQQQSTRQQKKGQKPAKMRPANTSTRSRIFSPPRQYYNPTWELEYEMEGPDHTQCSRDCDWCGTCAYREPW
ncbi:hypothetical protein F4824DRAFT_440309 [Ustulina deusta]|nr:hypothetical protein F4824DRAFT_440309 [Ustulina deusta]